MTSVDVSVGDGCEACEATDALVRCCHIWANDSLVLSLESGPVFVHIFVTFHTIIAVVIDIFVAVERWASNSHWSVKCWRRVPWSRLLISFLLTTTVRIVAIGLLVVIIADKWLDGEGVILGLVNVFGSVGRTGTGSAHITGLFCDARHHYSKNIECPSDQQLRQMLWLLAKE